MAWASSSRAVRVGSRFKSARALRNERNVVVPLRLYGTRRSTVVFVTMLAIGFAVFTFLPIWWLLVNASKAPFELRSTFGLWFARPFELFRNLADLFGRGQSFLQWLRNSGVYAGAGGVGATVLSTLAGYGFAHYRVPGRRSLFLSVLAALLVPFAAFAVPLYLLYARVHLVSTMAGIYLPLMVSPLGVYLMRVYARAVPVELLDAARIDSAGELRILFSVGVPMMLPGIATVFLLTTVGAWDNFFLPFIVNNNPSLDPLTVAMDTYGASVPAGLATIIPPTILFLIVQRYWQGLPLGAVND